MVPPPLLPAPGDVRHELERVLGSPDFDAPRRSRELLEFVVEQTLAGRPEVISQESIATAVFNRRDDFDPLTDPIVRIQAGRLRRSLERYYLLSGRQDVVRIDVPKGTYVPVFRGTSPEGSADRRNGTRRAARAAAPERAAAGDGWPAVLVSGFDVAGGSAELADVARDISDELALELGRYRAVRVLRRHDLDDRRACPPARFALEGRLRREGEVVRITARLVDRSTGEQVWGDEYHTAARPPQWSGPPEDVARVIAARVGSEEGVVVQALAAERRRARAADPSAYDAFLLAYEFFLALNPGTLRPALEALQRVVQQQPDCGPAWTRLARLYLANHLLEVAPISTPLDRAINCAHQGVRLDPASRAARCMLALALHARGELPSARNELGEALRASPGSLAYLETIGCLLTLAGDWERGAELSLSARRRNPHCPPHALFGIWADGLRRGDLDQAYQAAVEYRDATLHWPPLMRACCLGLLGRETEARAEVADLLARKPDFAARGRALVGYSIKFPELMDRIVDGLGRAGLRLD